MQQSADWPVLNSNSYHAILRQTELPKPAAQADNLVLWLGNAVDGSDGFRQAEREHLQAVIGGRRPESVTYVASYLRDQRLINYAEVHAHNAPSQLNIQMLPAGWERFEQLNREGTTSRTAFMAMQYNNAELDSLVQGVLRPAVEATGFELRVLTDVPRAGLIDDRLRVEIRRSRFLIADITHENLGAYWEAGFAEGLGKPVIYTCQRDVFSSVAHFDTNHHLTVMWDTDFPQVAETLKATIRATLPGEARMED